MNWELDYPQHPRVPSTDGIFYSCLLSPEWSFFCRNVLISLFFCRIFFSDGSIFFCGSVPGVCSVGRVENLLVYYRDNQVLAPS